MIEVLHTNWYRDTAQVNNLSVSQLKTRLVFLIPPNPTNMESLRIHLMSGEPYCLMKNTHVCQPQILV